MGDAEMAPADEDQLYQEVADEEPPVEMDIVDANDRAAGDEDDGGKPMTGTYKWRIEDFPNITDKVYSEKFEIGTHIWRLLIFPRGNKTEHVAFYLDAPEAPFTPLALQPRATFSLTMHSTLGPEHDLKKESEHQFRPNATDWGFTQFIRLDEALDPSRGFLRPSSLSSGGGGAAGEGADGEGAAAAAASKQQQQQEGGGGGNGPSTAATATGSGQCVEVSVRLTIVPDERYAYDSRRATGCVGLKNQGATCYMNSLMQAFFHLPALRRAVYALPTPEGEDDPSASVPLALQSLFYRLQYGRGPGSTKDLTRSFGWTAYDHFVQHDVEELTRILTDRLEERMKGTPVDGVLKELFELEGRQYVDCLHVPYKSVTRFADRDLKLDVAGHGDVYASLAAYVAPELMVGENRYAAGEGHGYQDARKGVVFDSFPPVLTLHLKRFAYDFATDTAVKVNQRYAFPETLDLDRPPNGARLFWDQVFPPAGGGGGGGGGPAPAAASTAAGGRAAAEANGGDSGGNGNGTVNKARNLYRLFAVMVHSGVNHGGHYFAYIRVYCRPGGSGGGGGAGGGDGNGGNKGNGGGVKRPRRDDKDASAEGKQQQQQQQQRPPTSSGGGLDANAGLAEDYTLVAPPGPPPRREEEEAAAAAAAAAAAGGGDAAAAAAGDDATPASAADSGGYAWRWLRFDDERVTIADARQAIDEQYGGDGSGGASPPGGGGGGGGGADDADAGANGPVNKGGRSPTVRRVGLGNNGGGGGSCSNAYELIYVREDDWPRVFCSASRGDLPAHLRARLAAEHQAKEARRRAKAEAHLYCVVRVATDADIAAQIGGSRHFDLVDYSLMPGPWDGGGGGNGAAVRGASAGGGGGGGGGGLAASAAPAPLPPAADPCTTPGLVLRLPKHTRFSELKRRVAEALGVPPNAQRYWIWAERQNKTVRPQRRLTAQEEGGCLMDLRELREQGPVGGQSAVKIAALMDLRLYLETPYASPLAALRLGELGGGGAGGVMATATAAGKAAAGGRGGGNGSNGKSHASSVAVAASAAGGAAAAAAAPAAATAGAAAAAPAAPAAPAAAALLPRLPAALLPGGGPAGATSAAVDRLVAALRAARRDVHMLLPRDIELRVYADEGDEEGEGGGAAAAAARAKQAADAPQGASRLLFLKFYDPDAPEGPRLTYLGHARLSCTATPLVLVPIVAALAGLDLQQPKGGGGDDNEALAVAAANGGGRRAAAAAAAAAAATAAAAAGAAPAAAIPAVPSLDGYDEVRFDPVVRADKLDFGLTLEKAEIEDGDVFVFQRPSRDADAVAAEARQRAAEEAGGDERALQVLMEQRQQHESVGSYLSYIKARRVVTFKPLPVGGGGGGTDGGPAVGGLSAGAPAPADDGGGAPLVPPLVSQQQQQPPADDGVFTLELARDDDYEAVTTKLARKLTQRRAAAAAAAAGKKGGKKGAGRSTSPSASAAAPSLDPIPASHLRLTQCNGYSGLPQRQPVKHGHPLRLEQLVTHGRRATDTLFYEALDLPLKELEMLKTLRVQWWGSGGEGGAGSLGGVPVPRTFVVRVPREATVADALRELASAKHLGLGSAQAPPPPLRLLEVYNGRIFKVLSGSDPVGPLSDTYWTLRAEPVPPEELQMARKAAGGAAAAGEEEDAEAAGAAAADKKKGGGGKGGGKAGSSSPPATTAAADAAPPSSSASSTDRLVQCVHFKVPGQAARQAAADAATAAEARGKVAAECGQQQQQQEPAAAATPSSVHIPVAPFGDPFLLRVRAGETLRDLKRRVRAQLLGDDRAVAETSAAVAAAALAAGGDKGPAVKSPAAFFDAFKFCVVHPRGAASHAPVYMADSDVVADFFAAAVCGGKGASAAAPAPAPAPAAAAADTAGDGGGGGGEDAAAAASADAAAPAAQAGGEADAVLAAAMAAAAAAADTGAPYLGMQHDGEGLRKWWRAAAAKGGGGK